MALFASSVAWVAWRWWIQILTDKCMSLFAVRLPRTLRGETGASQGVFARSDQLQVLNIGTDSDSAEMIDLEF